MTGKGENFESNSNSQPKTASGRPAERGPCAAGVHLGASRYRQKRHRGTVCPASGPALCVPLGQSAGPGGHHRRAPNRKRAERVLPAQDDCPGRALLPVPGRAQRLFSGGTESVLFPYPGTPGGGISPAPRLHGDRSRQPGPGQRHHPAHFFSPAQPHVPCRAAGGYPALAGVGGTERYPPMGL